MKSGTLASKARSLMAVILFTLALVDIGLALSLAGERQEALKHLQWVKDNGNKSFVEYPAALTELKRLEQSEVDHFRQRQ